MSELLWEPSAERVAGANLSRFLEYANHKHGTDLHDYPSRCQWSVEEIPALQEAVWQFFGILHSQPYTEVVRDPDKMPGARWFPGARLNFAENLPRHRDERTAIVFRSENGSQRSLSYAELYGQVARLAAARKAILSTGSPLSIESFHYVYREIKQDLCLSSISGGSDLVGCFALGNPICRCTPASCRRGAWA